MTRGEAQTHKVAYKGKNETFLVFVDDPETFKKWQGDKSVPLAHFISAFKIFQTHGQGVQGTYDAASKATLANEFDTENEDDVIKVILEKGELQSHEMPSKFGTKNASNGAFGAN